MVYVIRNRRAGSSLATLPFSATITGLRTCRNRRGARNSWMPARWMSWTNGALDPSPIGTSGPSTSMRAASMPQPASAARTCSTVPIRTRSRPSDVSQHRVDHAAALGRDLQVGSDIGPHEDDAAVGGGRRQRQPDRLAGVQPDALEGCSLLKVRWWKDSPSSFGQVLGKVRSGVRKGLALQQQAHAGRGGLGSCRRCG